MICRGAREHYYETQTQAKLKPEEIMSAIADGMDQAKLGLPHFKSWNRPKVSILMQYMPNA